MQKGQTLKKGALKSNKQKIVLSLLKITEINELIIDNCVREANEYSISIP